ncbi:MAG: matrixin family metalloprotease [Deltaproteobacteria bacterium]|nr:matrixin family metalloprotease [Deltaproteobacteria bacterium]
MAHKSLVTKLSVLAAVAVLAVPAGDVLAFNTIKLPDGTSAHWSGEDMPIPYYVNSAGSGLSSGVEDAMQAGFASWMEPRCTYIEFEYQGTSDSKDALPTDTFNNLFFVTGSWPDELGGAGVIAVCTPAIYSDGVIRDADIRFNAADFQWSLTGEAGKMDVQNIATHEEGHFLGLDHTEVLDATMYPYSTKGDTERRTPKKDDINGVCHIYPNSEAATGAFGEVCTDPSECDSGVCASDGFCSQECDPANLGSDCPGGYRCDEDESVCLPGDETNDLCTTCDTGVDCLSGLCLDDGNMSICSRSCLPGEEFCPSGYYCAEIEDSEMGGCWPEGESCEGVAEEQPAEYNKPCDENIPCKTGLVCVFVTDTDARCLYYCEEGSDTCPDGTVCHGLYGGGGACAEATADGGIGVPDIGGGGGGGGGGADGGGGGDADEGLGSCECSAVGVDARGHATFLAFFASIAALVVFVVRRRQ